MTRTRKWLLGLGAVAGLLAALGWGLASLLPSEAELAGRVASRLEATLGVPVSVGAVHWRLLPRPMVLVENAATRQPQPITVRQLRLYPAPMALWQGRLALERAELEGAVLPQLSLRGLPGLASKRSGGEVSTDMMALRQLVFRELRWIPRRGQALVLEGEAGLDPDGWPRTAVLRRPALQPATALTLERQGQEPRWAVRAQLGGGTALGELQLHRGAGGLLQLTGRLQLREVEVASALAAFEHRSIITGKAAGETTLSAHGATLVALAQSLHSRTAFTLGRATLLGFNLDQAVRSAGQSYAGQTALQTVSGQLDTQNTPQGMVVELSRLKASSGVLSASGQARLANGQVEAELAVDLVDGLVGVPLQFSGPVENVKVSVARGALAGAAVGTAVLPGVGTALGARLGAALGRMFGPAPGGKNSGSAAPPRTPP